tara:strand:+ start:85 stop:540 length:456 start_codon:yes stop_codon:yes gene_type:complete
MEVKKVKILNVKDLHKEIDEKTLKRNIIYNEILGKCNDKILQTTKTFDTCCFFALPEFIIGVPIFNSGKCRDFVIKHLIEGGFDIKYTHPNLLYISWNKKEKEKKKPKDKKIKQIKSKYRLIDDYEPSGNFIYTPSSLSSIKEKTKFLLNN